MRVTIENLAAHRGGRPVIADMNLAVPSGTVLGLLGPNGSGKSTLLRVIAGIAEPSSGRVFLDGTDTATLKRKALAQRIALMAQDHSEEFDMPAIDVVLLGRIPHGRGFGRDSADDVALAQDVLAQVGATHLTNRPFSALSGGERQRILFARALAQDTPVLILDEPTNHLDIAHQLELLDLIGNTDRTVLIALHDINLAVRFCDTIGILLDGQLVGYGAPGDILDTDLIREVFDVGSTAVAHPQSGRRHFLFNSRTLPLTPRSNPAQRTETSTKEGIIS